MFGAVPAGAQNALVGDLGGNASSRAILLSFLKAINTPKELAKGTGSAPPDRLHQEFDRQMGTLLGQVEKFGTSLENVGISILDSGIGTTLTGIVDVGHNLINWIKNLNQATGGLIGHFAELTILAGGIRVVAGASKSIYSMATGGGSPAAQAFNERIIIGANDWNATTLAGAREWAATAGAGGVVSGGRIPLMTNTALDEDAAMLDASSAGAVASAGLLSRAGGTASSLLKNPMIGTIAIVGGALAMSSAYEQSKTTKGVPAVEGLEVAGKNIIGGTVAGAEIGSIFPGLGTAIGAGIGAGVGAIATAAELLSQIAPAQLSAAQKLYDAGQKLEEASSEGNKPSSIPAQQKSLVQQFEAQGNYTPAQAKAAALSIVTGVIRH
jgi:hypothetical protein